jgi:hypothetical protein
MRNISSSSNRRSISKKKFINDSWKQNFINEIINTTEQKEEEYFYPIKEVRADSKNEWFHKSYKNQSPKLNYTKYNINPRMPKEYYYGYDNPSQKQNLKTGYLDNNNYPKEYSGSVNNKEEHKGTTIINNYYGINPDDLISKNPYNNYNQHSNQSKYYIEQEDKDVIDASIFANINKKEGFFKRLKNVFIPNSANSSIVKPPLESQDYSANRHNRRLARIKERYVEKQARKTNNPNVYLVD